MTRPAIAVHTALPFDEAAMARRSVRGFRPDPLPRELVEHVFALAGRAPSNCNTQPWHAVVAGGAALERLRTRIPAEFGAGTMTMDFPYSGRYDGVYKTRQYDAAEQLYSALGITREEKAARGVAFMRNFTFFGAPQVAFMFLPEWGGIREAADLGMFAQSVMLGLAAHGIASCPQTALSFAADTVRAELEVESTWKLVFGISFGYEDAADPANRCRVGRAALADTTRFVD